MWILGLLFVVGYSTLRFPLLSVSFMENAAASQCMSERNRDRL